MNILRIDSSPRGKNSVSRELADVLQQKLEAQGNTITAQRDLYYEELVTLGNEDRVNACFTPPKAQTDVQKDAVAGSNELAIEFANADAYIIAAPMYNFGVTAGLKTYIDLISRAGISFNYLPEGPIGLLKNKKAYVVVTTGGTPVGSEVDFVTPYLKTFLGFLGITDVTFIVADLVNVNLEEGIAKAKDVISKI
ncbi:NAD(P)H-dependent oxidoreductase [uncultured Dokdonia sp.]|uniref:FMN-dependent NADH-azoreductase n=1 Tax=uncultured Dokdonia sp. TaxID=575653 RepID=UPI0030EC1147|tara:strand:+ start:23202 stop:23786 length:585 start_codon:yes stop_codon:yes gene_type:complete